MVVVRVKAPPKRVPTFSTVTRVPARSVGSPSQIPSASAKAEPSRPATLSASAWASASFSRGRSATVTTPPPRAWAAAAWSTPTFAAGVGTAEASIVRFAPGSHARTVTFSLWWTPVTRGRKLRSPSPQRSVRSGGAVPRRKWSLPSATTTSKPMGAARRQRSSQSVSLLCWTKSIGAPAASTSPVCRPTPAATFRATSSAQTFWCVVERRSRCSTCDWS